MRSSSEDSRKRDGQPGRRNLDDKNDQSLTCLYVGNIDKRVQNSQFTELFKKYGDLEYCYLVYEPTSSDRSSKEVKISRGYGFVKFVKFEDLMKAKTELDGFDFNGRKIKVQVSKRNKPREATPGRYLGKKRNSPLYDDRRRRSYSRSSSGSYYERRRRQRKQKHRKRHQRSREQYERSRSRDKSPDYGRHRKRSYSNDRQHQRRREKDRQRERQRERP